MTLAALILAPTVITKTYTWHDPTQDRDIPARVTFPSEGKNLPVIVFSHGLGGDETSLSPIVNYWAEHGYAVFMARHVDSFKNGGNGGFEERVTINAFLTRLADCRFLYAVSDSVSKYVPELSGRLDTKHIIQAGHSFGAMTSQVLGGASMNGRTMSDPRPVAFCCISPQGSERGLGEDSWKGFTRPLLVVSGTEDTVPVGPKVDPVTRQNPFKYSPAGDKYLLWIQGASHNFGGISGSFNWRGAGTKNPDHVEWVRKTALAFFDAYAKSDVTQKSWLKSGKLTKETNGNAKLTAR